MAGIGFELKKIIDKDNIFAQARVYFMSSLITVGPMIICITLLAIWDGLFYCLQLCCGWLCSQSPTNRMKIWQK